jgi:two-component system LytT family response regulator
MDTVKFLQFIEVRHGNKREFLPIAKILHLDASSNYTTIHADGYQPVMVAKVLKKYQQLLEGYGFMRINNSVLINTNRVRRSIRMEVSSWKMNLCSILHADGKQY